jgi:hypothetical protein
MPFAYLYLYFQLGCTSYDSSKVLRKYVNILHSIHDTGTLFTCDSSHHVWGSGISAK